MEKRVLKENTACALYQSRACAILNTRSCADCPMTGKDGAAADSPETVQAYTELFESLLPEGGVAQLFESETCMLCKTEPKGKRIGYALLDLGHKEPEKLRLRSFLFKGKAGFMLPLQVSCCRECRNRYLLYSYLPLALPTVLTALLLPLFVEPHMMQAVRAVASWLPLLLLVLTAGGGYAAAIVIRNRLKKRYETQMYFDLLTHPTAKALLEKGWFPLFESKEPIPIFSRKRVRYGLGTALSSESVRKIPENGENVD